MSIFNFYHKGPHSKIISSQPQPACVFHDVRGLSSSLLSRNPQTSYSHVEHNNMPLKVFIGLRFPLNYAHIMGKHGDVGEVEGKLSGNMFV